MNSEFSHASNQSRHSADEALAAQNAQDKAINRLQQETEVMELIAYALLSIVGVFSFLAAIGVDFGTSFDRAPLLLLFTCCSALTYMTRKNRLARLQAERANQPGTGDKRQD
jgi:hypothetical protein